MSTRSKVRVAGTAAAIALAFITPANALGPTVIVGNVYDMVVKEPLELARWTKEFNQMAQQLQEARRIYQQTQTVANFIGDPKASVKDLRNVASIADTLARISGQDTTFAAQLNDIRTKGNDLNDLWAAGSNLKGEIDQTIKIGDQPFKRDVNLYEALAAAERLADTTREHLRKEAQREEDAQKRIDNTISSVLNNPNATQTQIEAALLSLQREQLALLSSTQRQQALLAMQELERRAQEAQAQARQVATSEAAVARSQQINQQTEAARAASVARTRADTQPATEAVPLDNSAIRVWLPQTAAPGS